MSSYRTPQRITLEFYVFSTFSVAPKIYIWSTEHFFVCWRDVFSSAVRSLLKLQAFCSGRKKKPMISKYVSRSWWVCVCFKYPKSILNKCMLRMFPTSDPQWTLSEWSCQSTGQIGFEFDLFSVGELYDLKSFIFKTFENLWVHEKKHTSQVFVPMLLYKSCFVVKIRK